MTVPVDLQHSALRAFHKSPALSGSVRVPGDKSITHRAILLGLIADGTTTVENWLDAGDCRSSIEVARALGADIEVEPNRLVIQGTAGRLKEPLDVLNCGNSGTTTRLVLGILSARVPFACVTGDASLRRRPMGRVMEPLTQMGADIRARSGRFAPLVVQGRPLRGISYTLPVASAQVKSAILLAGLLAESGDTTVTELRPTRNHTENMLTAFGAPLRQVSDGTSQTIVVSPGATLQGTRVVVPGDISSAAFILAAAAVVQGSVVTVQGVGLNPTRIGFLNVLSRMGANVQIANVQTIAGEPIGDVTVSSSALQGVRIDEAEIPSLIDELPILAVLAAYANGETVVSGAEELRVKETDRIRAVVEGLQAIGVDAEERPDGFLIRGQGKVKGGTVHSYDDHRIAMSFAVAGLASQDPVTVQNWDCVGISYPTFLETLRMVGADL
jgi:3-phosphoshikimate 1-carboxyvinyltransferase